MLCSAGGCHPSRLLDYSNCGQNTGLYNCIAIANGKRRGKRLARIFPAQAESLARMKWRRKCITMFCTAPVLKHETWKTAPLISPQMGLSPTSTITPPRLQVDRVSWRSRKYSLACSGCTPEHLKDFSKRATRSVDRGIASEHRCRSIRNKATPRPTYRRAATLAWRCAHVAPRRSPGARRCIRRLR